MIKSMIVAIDENNAIGKDNNLLCYLPNDLKYFKTVTQGHTVIMGRKTFESLPNGALPKRRNIVISHNQLFQAEGCETFLSIERAFDACREENEVFIIGGGSVYKMALSIVDKLYITVIHHKFEETDTFFPVINTSEWKKISEEKHLSDEKNKFDHSFVIYTRIS